MPNSSLIFVDSHEENHLVSSWEPPLPAHSTWILTDSLPPASMMQPSLPGCRRFPSSWWNSHNLGGVTLTSTWFPDPRDRSTYAACGWWNQTHNQTSSGNRSPTWNSRCLMFPQHHTANILRVLNSKGSMFGTLFGTAAVTQPVSACLTTFPVEDGCDIHELAIKSRMVSTFT